MADLSSIEKARIWERLMEDPSTMWVQVSIDGAVGGKQRAVVTAIGDTPLDDMKARLDDKSVQFVMMKVFGVMDDGQLTGNKRSKFVYVVASGPQATRIKKATVSVFSTAMALLKTFGQR